MNVTQRVDRCTAQQPHAEQSHESRKTAVETLKTVKVAAATVGVPKWRWTSRCISFVASDARTHRAAGGGFFCALFVVAAPADVALIARTLFLVLHATALAQRCACSESAAPSQCRSQAVGWAQQLAKCNATKVSHATCAAMVARADDVCAERAQRMQCSRFLGSTLLRTRTRRLTCRSVWRAALRSAVSAGPFVVC